MNDKIAIVTGANRGIGKETALGLAKEGMTVILACRNPESARLACEELKSLTQNSNIAAMKLDISSRDSIRNFVEDFKNSYGRLNILVNNAGVCTTDHKRTVDNFEPNIGINYVGTFLLTMQLLPFFEKGSDNRIINVISNIYKIGWFRFEKINDYRWFRAYAVSKYMVLLFTVELAERLRGVGISVNAVHPGIVRTSIMYTHRWFDILIRIILSPFFIDVAEGAKQIIHLATSGEAGNVSGAYFHKTRRKRIPRIYNRQELRAALWEYSSSLLKNRTIQDTVF
jgi:NAD(P)-dependent dehydrogenase (short-subunit alcohol dehydrogenase family)